MSGRHSRSKGARTDSSAVGGRFAGDVILPPIGRDLCVQVKVGANGFRELYSCLNQRDARIVKVGRQEPLVIVRLSVAAEIARAGTLAAELTAIRSENPERDVKGRVA
jgi:hypothetical protein